MKRICGFLLGGMVLSMVSVGCLFQAEPLREVSYYDLKPTYLQLPSDIQVQVDNFRSTDPGKFKMNYQDGNRVIIDDYHKWVQQPEYLITRYLQTAFSRREVPESGKAQVYRVGGTVFLMRIDLKAQEVKLGVEYVIRGESGRDRAELRESRIFTASIKKNEPAYFAEAMSNAAKELALELEAKILQLNRNKSGEIEKK